MSLTASGSLPVQKEKVRGEEEDVPYTEVMDKFKKGKLHSGSEEGPEVKKKSQAVAIMLDEKRKAEGGKTEYQPKGMAGHIEDAAKKRREKK